MTLQFCLAHLIRDVKFLTTLPDVSSADVAWTVLREALRELFGVIHRREQLTAPQFQASPLARGPRRRRATTNVPASHHCRNLAKRFETHGESYFRFITTPGGADQQSGGASWIRGSW